MKTGRRMFKLLFAVSVAFLFTAITAFAQEVPLTFKGRDAEQGGYRYEMAGFGGFTALLEDGSTGEMNIISIDDTLSCNVFSDGEPISGSKDDIYMTVGSYEMVFTPKDQKNGEYTARYTFTVENDLGVGYNFQDMEVGFKKIFQADSSYDKETGMYQYTLPNNCTFQMSVPEGAWSADPVELSVDEEVISMDVLLDGKKIEEPLYNRFSEPGDYCLQMTCKPGDYDGRDLVIYRYDVHFRVLKNGFVKDSILTAPVDYKLHFLDYKGRPVKLTNSVSTVLRQDGTYRAIFEPVKEGFPSYRIDFKRDTIIPGLTFSAPITEGMVQAPLTIKKMEEDSEVTVMLNGIPLSDPSDTLIKSGQYQIMVTDKAGNTEIYSFYLKQEYHLFNRQMIVLLVFVLLGGGMLAWLNGFYIRVK